jgi:hypothetical protein
MKYIAFTVLGLVLVAAIGLIVLRANMPTAKLTIHAVRPMGTNYIWETSLTGRKSWPVWEFVITNIGPAPAYWHPRLRYENAQGATFEESPWPSDPTWGDLGAGYGTPVYMPVPADPTTVWRAGVEYSTPINSLELKLSSWCRSVPKLQSLLPNYGKRYANDIWRSTTNITTDH